jgi:hypothetical protein
MSSTMPTHEGNGSTAVADDTVRIDGGTVRATPTSIEGEQSGEGGSHGLTDKQKRILAVVLVVHLIVAKLTWLDLMRRPDVGVRGPKGLWRLWSLLNTTGSLAYWTVGRRPVRDGEIETMLA